MQFGCIFGSKCWILLNPLPKSLISRIVAHRFGWDAANIWGKMYIGMWYRSFKIILTISGNWISIIFDHNFNQDIVIECSRLRLLQRNGQNRNRNIVQLFSSFTIDHMIKDLKNWIFNGVMSPRDQASRVRIKPQSAYCQG